MIIFLKNFRIKTPPTSNFRPANWNHRFQQNVFLVYESWRFSVDFLQNKKFNLLLAFQFFKKKVSILFFCASHRSKWLTSSRRSTLSRRSSTRGWGTERSNWIRFFVESCSVNWYLFNFKMIFTISVDICWTLT